MRPLLLCSVAIVLFLLPASLAAAQCTLDQTDPSVTICQPADATVTSPVRIVAGSNSTSPVQVMQVYLDRTKVYEVNGSSVDTTLAMTDGAHRLTVQGKNQAGVFFNKTINITVGSGAPPPCSPATDPGVAICEPTSGATVASPVRVVATSRSSSSAVTVMQIYVDGLKKYEVNAPAIDTSLAMTAGTHKLTVQAVNAANQVFKTTENITVGSGGGGGDLTNIKHIIFYMQENRPFDQYFGRMGTYRANKGNNDSFDALPLNASLPDYNDGRFVSPYHLTTACHENLSPGWNESNFSYHNGANDYFMKASGSIPSSIDPQGTRAMGYYDWNDLPYYYELAWQYGTSDRWFSSIMAPTVPNRMYLFAGTSFGHIRPDPAPAGGWTPKTIFRELSEKGVSWKYYYQDSSVFLADWADWSTQQNKVVNIAQYYTDLQNGTLPAVVFIERASQLNLDEHPTQNLQKGAANTKKLIDALQASSAWSSSVFILTFDEGGGFYDHVAPQPAVKPDGIAPMWRSTDIKADFDRTGFRVPLIVVSPWVKPHIVSHVVRDSTAILKLISVRFGLTPLTARVSAQDDMTEMFDFLSPPRLGIPALPAQPTSLVCDKTKEKAPGF
ncbi:MAG: alkaline phosphatase family protein [Candidatus Koribacter versatilis]|uniref:Alkaline phosphatase family protein n=1 Tax=Candidatus Korobacter versatilis TaxID=658062 RepID=A0A932AAL1_9BACT|nr:alkaline phosphatase family protein [Candidatus Koribacter versatilis]